jgi:hypothetical protein
MLLFAAFVGGWTLQQPAARSAPRTFVETYSSPAFAAPQPLPPRRPSWFSVPPPHRAAAARRWSFGVRVAGSYQPIGEGDFASNWQYKDESGNPERVAWIERRLPGVASEALTNEVPEMLIWSPSEIEKRLKVLEDAFPGHDLAKVLSEHPNIIWGAPYLRDAMDHLGALFPNITLEELMPPCRIPTIADVPHPFTYPGVLDWEVPYTDPGLMGNYSVKAELVDAMEASNANIFGLWKEDVEALERFQGASERATLAFETRALFLQEYYGLEQFKRFYADDVFGETVGHVGEWVKKHPGYDTYMDEKLDGYEGRGILYYRTLTPLEKEELMVRARDEGYFYGNLEGEGEEDEEDLWADDEAEAGAEGGDNDEEDEDDREALEVMLHMAFTFEARAGFLEKHYGVGAYRGDVVRRVRRETAGTADEFLARYPGYSQHLDRCLLEYYSGDNGEEPLEPARLAGLSVDEKEDAFVAAMRERNRLLVEQQRAELQLERPILPPIVKAKAQRSRVEYERELAEEQARRVEALTDEDVEAHQEAYEQYVDERFAPFYDATGEPVRDLPDWRPEDPR